MGGESPTDDGGGSTKPTSKCSSCHEKECFVTNTKGQRQRAHSKWLECDLCQQWYHSTCQGLQPQDVQTITKLDDKRVKWFCDTCVTAFKDISQSKGNEGLAQYSALTSKLHGTKTLSIISLQTFPSNKLK